MIAQFPLQTMFQDALVAGGDRRFACRRRFIHELFMKTPAFLGREVLQELRKLRLDERILGMEVWRLVAPESKVLSLPMRFVDIPFANTPQRQLCQKRVKTSPAWIIAFQAVFQKRHPNVLRNIFCQLRLQTVSFQEVSIRPEQLFPVAGIQLLPHVKLPAAQACNQRTVIHWIEAPGHGSLLLAVCGPWQFCSAASEAAVDQWPMVSVPRNH